MDERNDKADLKNRIETAQDKADKSFKPEKAAPAKNNGVKEYKKGSEAAITLGVAIFVCTWIGKSMDDHFETSPLYLIIFLLVGIATGFYNLYKSSQE